MEACELSCRWSRTESAQLPDHCPGPGYSRDELATTASTAARASSIQVTVFNSTTPQKGGGRQRKKQVFCLSWTLVVHAFNPSTWETEAGNERLLIHSEIRKIQFDQGRPPEKSPGIPNATEEGNRFLLPGFLSDKPLVLMTTEKPMRTLPCPSPDLAEDGHFISLQPQGAGLADHPCIPGLTSSVHTESDNSQEEKVQSAPQRKRAVDRTTTFSTRQANRSDPHVLTELPRKREVSGGQDGGAAGSNMGHQQLYWSHPRKFGQGSRSCRVCSNRHGLIRKYGLNMCRQCFRQYAKDISFINPALKPSDLSPISSSDCLPPHGGLCGLASEKRVVGGEKEVKRSQEHVRISQSVTAPVSALTLALNEWFLSNYHVGEFRHMTNTRRKKSLSLTLF
ncbi:hypothetical protein U0070_018456 [Myodes glareolus]|uniref:Small ribosomal subunit protein uS14 n=3 Tax=Euteleostomi TaxID=117571 RepID=A0AAW0JV57_MYOGA